MQKSLDQCYTLKGVSNFNSWGNNKVNLSTEADLGNKVYVAIFSYIKGKPEPLGDDTE